MDFKFVYKICTKVEWLEAKIKGKLSGTKKDIEDGYIHFSDKDQLKGTLKKFFPDQKNLILLKMVWEWGNVVSIQLMILKN